LPAVFSVADEKTVELFADAAGFEAWLEDNHADHPGVWMRIAKRGAPEPSVSYDEALDVALAYGWIDGQKRSLDADYWLQAFTRRRPRSVWSKRNVDKATSMIVEGTMKPAGLAEVDAAKADGRWDRAYEGSSASQPSPEFLAALEANPAAKSFYASLNSINRYALYYRIQNARTQETRDRKIADFVAMLERGETLH
jgi:uncharacterized protein YdeI (YjbR/CyaY-like superfamily)